MNYNAILIIALATLNFMACAPAYCLGKLEASSKWVAEIKTEEVNDRFVYRNSSLRSLVKAEISLLQNSQEKPAKKYEDIWTKDGKAYGLQRFQSLNIPSNDDVSIKVKLGSDISVNQQQAAANAILRLLLELYKNDNIVTRIIVPQSALSGLSNRIQNYNFSTFKPQGTAASLVVFLQSEEGSSVTLYYTR